MGSIESSDVLSPAGEAFAEFVARIEDPPRAISHLTA